MVLPPPPLPPGLRRSRRRISASPFLFFCGFFLPLAVAASASLCRCWTAAASASAASLAPPAPALFSVIIDDEDPPSEEDAVPFPLMPSMNAHAQFQWPPPAAEAALEARQKLVRSFIHSFGGCGWTSFLYEVILFNTFFLFRHLRTNGKQTTNRIKIFLYTYSSTYVLSILI